MKALAEQEDMGARFFADEVFVMIGENFIIPSWVVDFAEQYHEWKLAANKPTQVEEELVIYDTINNEMVEVGTLKEAEKYVLDNFTEYNTAHPDYWGFDLYVKVGIVDENCKATLSAPIKPKEK